MSQKRQPEEEKGSDEKRQKIPALKGVILEALKLTRVQELLSAVEPMVRKVVKEEVEKIIEKHLASMTRQCGNQIYLSTSRSLQLQFRNNLSLPIFTGTRIEGEDSSAVNIALVNGSTGQVVESGPESSMRIEILVLEGDFEGNAEDTWTFEEFKNNIVREREGKRSLLTGDLFLDLNQGIGVVGEISFTDNSSWTRSRKFRLGARTVDGYFNGVRVREAKSEPFMVKDHRGELYKKHYPPLLWDEVWRLEKIGKDGAFHRRLTSENIKSVKDFLTLLSTDAPRLRNILGSGMSAKMWEVTIEHARTCMLPNQMYVYFANSGERDTKVGVVFNIVGEVMGLLSQHQFMPVDDLPESEKANAHNLVKLAFNHYDDVVIYNDTGTTSSYQEALPASFASVQENIFLENFGPSTSDGGFIFGSPSNDNIFIGPENAYSLNGCANSGELMLDECVEYLDSAFLSQDIREVGSAADLETAVTGFLAMSAKSAAARDKAKTVWGTLVFVLRWRCSIKKIVATKRRGIDQKERFG